MRYQAIIFDFDYTLADSSRGVVECINYALQQMNIPIISEKEVKLTIGLSLINTFLKLTGQSEKNQNEKGEEFTKFFISRANEVMTDMTTIFDTVPETLKILKNKDLKLGIVSTKFRYRIMEILKRENLLNYFNIIIGGEDVDNHKPDPEGLHKAIDFMGIPVKKCLYVGDSVTDAKTSERTKIDFVAVLSGVTKREELLNYSNIKIISSIKEIPKLLDSK
ncbi:MAG: HAD family hydrolase [Candidatus Hodarchaeales archaeon]|jgi:phosphoglycolate phosphatase